MHPDTMRAIDYWIGVPLTALATALTKFSRGWAALFGHTPPPPQTPRRVCFLELAEIGGLVVAYPMLRRARELFPDAELCFLTFSGGRGLMELEPLRELVPEENLYIIRPTSLPVFLKDTFTVLLRMRKAGVDASVNLETFARFSTLLAWGSGARQRVGFARFHDEGRYCGDLLTHPVGYNPHRHAGETFLTLIEALAEAPAVPAKEPEDLSPPSGCEPMAKIELAADLSVPSVPSNPALARTVLAKVREDVPGFDPATQKIAIVNPNASDLVAVRRWPREHVRALVTDLLADESVVVVFTGTPDERGAAEELKQEIAPALQGRIANLAGKTTLAELIEVYHQARVLVTNDSGPAHFASLTELPVIVLFGPETPAIYGPLGTNVTPVYLRLACSPCVSAYNQKRSPCTDNQCMKRIAPERILTLAREHLA